MGTAKVDLTVAVRLQVLFKTLLAFRLGYHFIRNIKECLYVEQEFEKQFTIESFEQYLNNISVKNKIYIYGAGMYGKLVGDFLNLKQIKWDGFIDQNQNLKQVCNKPVCTLDEAGDLSEAYVIISLSSVIFFEEIDGVVDNLNTRGCLEDNIMILGDHTALIDEITYITRATKECLNRNTKLKDIFRGRRCFVVGNGPSLTIQDLEKISGEVTMGCNSIINLVMENKWKPTCYFFEDSGNFRNWEEHGYQMENIIKSCDYVITGLKNDMYQRCGLKYDNLFYLYGATDIPNIKFSDDITKYVYSFGTTVAYMLQTAVYMGIKEIYLIGVDFSFGREIHADGSLIKNQNIRNHSELMGEEPQDLIYAVDLILKDYTLALEYANSHGIKICNATRGGKLEVFERVDFDSLFE
jgi:hypothetical protein